MPPLWSLPPRPALFVDRESQMRTIKALQHTADQQKMPLRVLITGPAGAGKSTLLRFCAYALAGEYPAGAVYADLRGVERGSSVGPVRLAAELLAQLKVPWRDVPETAEFLFPLLRSKLAKLSVQILIDDVDSAGQLEPLFGDVSNAAVIVTSRKPLARLKSHGFESIELAGFEEERHSIELITALAGSVLKDVPRETLAIFHRLSAGLPLILSINGSHLGQGEPIAEYLKRLTGDGAIDALELDDVRLYAGPCEEAYNSLSPEDRVAFRRLAVVAGPHFDSSVGAAALDLSDDDIRGRLHRLVRRYLVHDRGDGCFELHHFVRSYAAGKARSDDPADVLRAVEVRSLWRRMWFAVGLDKVISDRPVDSVVAEFHYVVADPAYTGSSAVASASAAFLREWDNFRSAALRAAELGEGQVAVILALSMWTFAYRTGRAGDLIEPYRRALTYGDGPGTRWQLLRDLGALHEKIGEPELAREYQQQAKEVGYLPGTASEFEWHGLACESEGRYEEALEWFEKAWRAVPLLGDEYHEIRSYALLRMQRGRVSWKRRHPDIAEPDIVAALSYFEQSDHDRDRFNEALCRELLGDIARAKGDNAAARLWWEPTVDLFVDHAAFGRAADVLDKLAVLCDELGEEAEAVRFRDRARVLRQES